MTLAGKVLQNRYLVNQQIGAGGMGTVYLATDERFGSTVAIKETLFSDPNLRRAFEREAQLLNSLRHPALPRVSDHFTEGNGAFIVMEYIGGEDLSAMVERDGAFAVPDVLRWADALLDALDYLHNQKFPVIHRDIKPQNLKLTPRGEIILLDFGLAKGSASELSQVTAAKSVFGYSRSYAPLEQIQGTGTDPRSDLYGLSATLYHLLTGQPPTDALSRATAVLNGNADPLQSSYAFNPKIPVAVSNVLQQAMALNANLRPATAAQMRFALSEAVDNPETAEFYDGTTILSGDALAVDVFTQNTRLIKDAATTREANGAQSSQVNSAATKINYSQNFTNSPNSPTTVEIKDQATKPQNLVSPRRSVLISAGVTVIILLLGTLAFFGSNLFPANNGATENQIKQSGLTSDPQIDKPSTALPENPSSTSNANIIVTAADAPTAAVNNATKTASNAQTKAVESAKNNAGKNKSGSSAQRQTNVAADDGDDLNELKDLGKEIDEAFNESKNKGTGFDGVPPEIRSNDPRNPVDRKKLKIFVKKQQDAALKEVREANRLRLERGLPPNFPPVPPRVRKHRQRNEDDKTDSDN